MLITANIDDIRCRDRVAISMELTLFEAGSLIVIVSLCQLFHKRKNNSS